MRVQPRIVPVEQLVVGVDRDWLAHLLLLKGFIPLFNEASNRAVWAEEAALVRRMQPATVELISIVFLPVVILIITFLTVVIIVIVVIVLITVHEVSKFVFEGSTRVVREQRLMVRLRLHLLRAGEVMWFQSSEWMVGVWRLTLIALLHRDLDSRLALFAYHGCELEAFDKLTRCLLWLHGLLGRHQ